MGWMALKHKVTTESYLLIAPLIQFVKIKINISLEMIAWKSNSVSFSKELVSSSLLDLND